MKRVVLALTTAGVLSVAPVVVAQTTAPPVPDAAWTHPLAVAVFVVLLGTVPFLFMALTAFVKISTVLHITRSAIGASTVPSNAIVLALSAALTLVAMTPVGLDVARRLDAISPTPKTELTTWVGQVAESVREPLRTFLKANSSPEEQERFLGLVKERYPAADRDAVRPDHMLVLMPAFMVTELLEAFALGFAIFLPFLVIDLVVANVLLALGIQGMNGLQISLPLKLLLFVSTSGWGLLAESLITSYA